MSLGPDGRYRPVAPLPPIGGVLRELAVDRVADHRVAVARVEGGAHADVVRRHLAMVQTCRHPSLATVLEVLPDGESGTLVVEAQSDGPLLAASSGLPQASALLLGADIAEALGVLHAAGMAHGGLAPDAIALDASGRPLVLGAGLAGARAHATGGRQPSASDDLRALGALLYLMLTGRLPSTPAAAPAALAPDVTPALNGLVLALLSDDPQRPPPPAGPVAERLRAMAGVPLPKELVPAPPPRPPLPVAPRRGVSDAALAAIVGGIALAAILLAVAVVDGGSIGLGGGETAEEPTFTLPTVESITLEATLEEELPLEDVLTEEILTEEVFTEDVFTDEVITETVGTATVETVATDIVTITG